jgi:hypothetical protein
MTNLSTTPKGVTSLEPEMADRGGFAALKDDQGRFRTQYLFWESRHPKFKPVFTTKKRDHEGCSSMYLKYMEIGDPTEYQVAIRLLGSWEHWQALCASKWFTDMVNGWREELMETMHRAVFYQMKNDSINGTGTPLGQTATKWIDSKYGKQRQPKRGRPSKAERDNALKLATEEERNLQDDAKLIGIVK